MTVITSKEFASNQKKYFDMAVNEEVCIKRGANRYQLMCQNFNNTNVYDEVLEPDDDLRRAITAEEILEGLYEYIDKMFAKDE